MAGDEREGPAPSGGEPGVVLELARFEPEEYARIRSAVESGKLPCGSAAHLKIIDQDRDMAALSRRDYVIIRLSIYGCSTLAISGKVGLGPSRVDQIIKEFFR